MSKDTITKWIEAVCEEICDNYCKYPERCENEEDLHERYCDYCPLVNEV